MRVDNNKTNKAQASCFCNTASHHSKVSTNYAIVPNKEKARMNEKIKVKNNFIHPHPNLQS